MYIFVDSEGDPTQEFSAIYVNETTYGIEDVFHHHVCYPFKCDYDQFSRRCVHGLNRDYLRQHGLANEKELVTLFHEWLKTHPYSTIYGHAPHREEKLLSLSITDVCLKQWQERLLCHSHQVAVKMKKNLSPICNVICDVHDKFSGWLPKNVNSPSLTDCAKMCFSHHCSLYDCVECYLFVLHGE